MFNWIGVAFVSENVPNYQKVEDEVQEETDRLRDEAQEKLDEWLEARGLERVMGVIVTKGSVKNGK